MIVDLKKTLCAGSLFSHLGCVGPTVEGSLWYIAVEAREVIDSLTYQVAPLPEVLRHFRIPLRTFTSFVFEGLPKKHIDI